VLRVRADGVAQHHVSFHGRGTIVRRAKVDGGWANRGVCASEGLGGRWGQWVSDRSRTFHGSPVEVRWKSGGSPVEVRCKSGASPVQSKKKPAGDSPRRQSGDSPVVETTRTCPVTDP
jgi:hypothetical protein